MTITDCFLYHWQIEGVVEDQKKKKKSTASLLSIDFNEVEPRQCSSTRLALVLDKKQRLLLIHHYGGSLNELFIFPTKKI